MFSDIGAARAAVAAVLSLAAFPAVSDTIRPALETPYIYFNVYDAYHGFCFGDDASAQAQRMLVIQQGVCGGTAPRWQGPWPNFEGETSGQPICFPPSGGPYSPVHEEGRSFQYDNQRCAGQSTDSIRRHFFYYCPSGYQYFVLLKDGNGTAYSPGVPACRRAPGAPLPEKELGCDRCQTQGDGVAGNPINFASANKFQIERDYAGSGAFPLQLERYYNSNALEGGAFGPMWRHSYERSIESHLFNAAITVASLHRPDGRLVTFNWTGTAWVADADVTETLSWTTDAAGVPTSWIVRDAQDSVERYDASGRLLSIADRAGRQQLLTYDLAGNLSTVSDSFGARLAFSYDTNSRISSVTDPAGALYSYGYDAAGNLATVIYPGGAQRQYVYNESINTANANLPRALTGIVDESGQRYATWQYDIAGRAISSEHGGGAERVGVSYTTNGATVTDALGNARTFTFSLVYGVRKIASATGVGCSSCGEFAAYSYDGAGNVQSRTDFKGVTETQVFDGLHREISRTEASGTARARTVTTQWHPTLHVPTLIAEPTRTTGFSYDANGNQLTKTVTDTSVTPNVSRTWKYTYDSLGRMLTADGPRTDVSDLTSYTYYNCATGNECGQLHTVTDALNHVTTFNTYNAHAQPLAMTDSNGVVTTLAYDARQHLISRTVGAEQTAFSYWPTGLVKKITLPDGSSLSYIYDAAHRLTEIDDAAGNRIVYTLDAMGNRTAENLYDPSNALARTHSRVFDSLSRLRKDIAASGAESQQTIFGYDNNGNQTTLSAPLSRSSMKQYDELNRVERITDAGSGVTQYAYDASGNLTSVTDPRTLQTTYSYNGFGDLKRQVSPDTGATINEFDSAGNLKSSQDARGKTGTYTYDALNRPTRLAYGDQSTAYKYDLNANGVGRLSKASDAAHSLSWSYDAVGRIVSKTQKVGSISKTLSYSYANGLLTSVTLPSGQVVTYGYDDGQVTSVSVGGKNILSGVMYDPFGPVRHWTWGNGSTAARDYDTDGKIMRIDSAGLSTFQYDDAFRITGIADAMSARAFAYDSLDRLTSSTGGSAARAFTYDADGNRLNATKSYAFDAAGNAIGDGTATFAYNDAGRMISATVGSATTAYVHNALGQRAKKSNAMATTYFIYDESNHLVGEYDGSGRLVQEIVWLGDIPVASLRTKGRNGVDVFYIHSDYLNTPRKITRPSDNAIVWAWDSDPFGTTAPNEDPSGLGRFVFNLRFAGQYFDSETGLHYNSFRDYDPQTGRYIESDPIGLSGGSFSTYSYVGGNPIAFADPLGLGSGDICGVCSPGDTDCLLYGGNLCFPAKDVRFPVKFPYSGNWCGPGWTGGHQGMWEQLTSGDRANPKSPQSSQDSCCMTHDQRYAACRKQHPCDKKKRFECLKAADRKLAACSANAGNKYSSPLWWHMRFGSPTAGDDDERCSCKKE